MKTEICLLLCADGEEGILGGFMSSVFLCSHTVAGLLIHSPAVLDLTWVLI